MIADAHPRVAVMAGVSALLALALALAWAGPAHADTMSAGSYAKQLLQLVNFARQQRGLVAVQPAAGTTEVAQAWTQQLADAGRLSHNADLGQQLATHGSPDWQDCGEVVGDGPADDPQALFDAYMNSSVHRGVILDPAIRFIGIGVVDSGSQADNTMDVVNSYGAPAAAPAPSAPAPVPPAGASAPAAAAALPAPAAIPTAPAPARVALARAAPAPAVRSAAPPAPAPTGPGSGRLLLDAPSARLLAAPGPVGPDRPGRRTLPAVLAAALCALVGVGVLRSLAIR